MRIVLVVHKFPPESIGGVETYSWSLGRALAQMGHEVVVFYPLQGISSADSRAERDGLCLWRAPLSKDRASESPILQFWHTFRDVGIENRFVQLLREAKPEVVHFQHVQGVSARLIDLARHLPRLVTLHDYWFFCANSQLLRPDGSVCAGPRWGWNCVDCLTIRPRLRNWRRLRPLVALPLLYRNCYLRQVVQSVPLFLAPSDFLRHQYLQQGFDSQRIRKIELGLDSARLSTAGSEGAIVHASSLPGVAAVRSGLRFGFLGALAPHKGVHVLIEAFNQLPQQATLTLYGNEQFFPEYVARLKSIAVHPGIRFAGSVDHQMVGAALQNMDCLIVPSVWYENSPVVIQEAYAAGVPVVASRLGALAEKVTDGETGCLFAPGDSADLTRVMQELIERPELLPRWRNNLRPPTTIEEHARQLLETYRQLQG